MNNKIGTIKLTGNDARSFVHSLFNPTHKEIEEKRRKLDCINRFVTIRTIEDGFEAAIDDLDLSFLDGNCSDSRLSIEFSFKPTDNEIATYSNDNLDFANCFFDSTMTIKVDLGYSTSDNGDFLSIAA